MKKFLPLNCQELVPALQSKSCDRSNVRVGACEDHATVYIEAQLLKLGVADAVQIGGQGGVSEPQLKIGLGLEPAHPLQDV